jgi:hypothetical protein
MHPKSLIKPNVDAINAARAQGVDPSEIMLPSLSKLGVSGKGQNNLAFFPQHTSTSLYWSIC